MTEEKQPIDPDNKNNSFKKMLAKLDLIPPPPIALTLTTGPSAKKFNPKNPETELGLTAYTDFTRKFSDLIDAIDPVDAWGSRQYSPKTLSHFKNVNHKTTDLITEIFNFYHHYHNPTYNQNANYELTNLMNEMLSRNQKLQDALFFAKKSFDILVTEHEKVTDYTIPDLAKFAYINLLKYRLKAINLWIEASFLIVAKISKNYFKDQDESSKILSAKLIKNN